MQKKLSGLYTVFMTVILAAAPAADSVYYRDRSGIIGFQEYQSAFPNKLKLTEAERRQSYRMASFNVPLNFSQAEAAKVAKWYKDAGFNMVLAEKCRILVMDLLPEEKPTHSRRPLAQVIKDSGTFFSEARKLGMQTMHHVTCTMVPGKLLVKKPQWAVVNLNTGKTEQNAYGTGNTCVINDEFFNIWLGKLEKLLRESPADAVMIDEIQFFAPHLCGCGACREKFKKDTGFELPPNGSYSGWHAREPEKFRRWRKWRVEKIIERQLQCREVLKRLNTQTIFSGYLCNFSSNYGYYAFAHDITNLAKYLDSIGLESMPHSLRYTVYYPLVIMELKILRGIAENTGNAPWVLFYAQDTFNDMISGLTAFLTGTRQWWWLAGKKDHAWRPMLQWEIAHENLLVNTENTGNIALYFNSSSRDCNPFGGTSWMLGFTGLANALTDENVPYRVVSELDFRDAAGLRKKADTVIAMNSAVWSKKSLKTLEKFIKDGGTLITSGNFSMADDNFRKLDNFAAAELLGFDYDGTAGKSTCLEIPSANDVTGRLTGSFPCSQPVIKVKNIAEDVNIAGYYVDGSSRRHPGILWRKVGKGVIIYFASNPERCTFFHHYNLNLILPGQMWQDQRDPRWSALLARCAKSFNSKVLFELDNFPAGVVADGYRQSYGKSSGTVVNLVNFQSLRAQGGVQDFVNNFSFPPASGAKKDKNAPMKVKIFAPSTGKVYLFSMDFDGVLPWKFEKDGDFVTVEIPELYRHLVIYCSDGSDEEFIKRPQLKKFPAPKPLRVEENPALASPFDPEAVIAFADGKEFEGGVLRKTWLKNEPVRIIYGSRSGKSTMKVTLELPRQMVEPRLEIGALCDDIINSRAPIVIKFDGKVIFTGKAPFPDYAWAVRSFPLGVDKVTPGKHTVEIINTGNGPLNNVPWLGVSFCRIKAAGTTLQADFSKDKRIPLGGKFISPRGKWEKEGLRFGTPDSGMRIPLANLTGESGAVSFSFQLIKPENELKGILVLCYLRPSSLASLFFTVSGKKEPFLSAGFHHPVNKSGKLFHSGEPLEYGKVYRASALWKDGKFQLYLDGKLLCEGDAPVKKIKFNDLFIGPFKDAWLKSSSGSDNVIIRDLQIKNCPGD